MLFAISDLHLSFGVDKPMDIFHGWENYTDRLKANWKRKIKEDDVVVLAGDISWAIKIDDAVKDFDFINSLPGKKIILKGNHDYWWSTVSKLNKFFCENGFESISLLHNNSYSVGNIAVCGTRGWMYDGTSQKDEKVILRESSRLETSIVSGIENGKKPVVFLHYPPVYGEFVCEEIFSVIKKYNIEKVYYGHIHGIGKNKSVSEFDGVKFKLISGDCVDFTPICIPEYM